MAEKQSSKPVRLVKRILAINKEAELGVYAGYATLFIQHLPLTKIQKSGCWRICAATITAPRPSC